jgi:periplasmic protein TonB
MKLRTILNINALEPHGRGAALVERAGGSEGLFRMGQADGAGGWERWGWALLIATFIHAGAVLAALWAPRFSPRAAPPPEEPQLVLLTFMAPRAASPVAQALPAAVPQRVLPRARAHSARPRPMQRMQAPLPEKAPAPEEAEPAPQEETPAAPAEPPETAVEGTGAVGAVVAGLVNSAAKEGVGTELGAISGGEAVDLKQVSRPPAVLEQAVPQYPRQARSQGIEGLVLVRIIIGIDGRVEPGHTRIIRSVPELDEAAMAAVRQWRFSPALGHHGRPVRVIVDIPVQFSLE